MRIGWHTHIFTALAGAMLLMGPPSTAQAQYDDTDVGYDRDFVPYPYQHNYDYTYGYRNFDDDFAYDDEFYEEEFLVDDDYGIEEGLYDDPYDLYGYNEAYDEDDWFYDYYDNNYVQYDDYDDDDELDMATTYYDYDHDGLYDAVTTYYDTDDDGTFDESSYYSFNGDIGEQDQDEQQAQQRQDRQRMQLASTRSVRGTIRRIKQVSLPDAKHHVVQISAGRGNTVVADLGSADQNLDLKLGERVQLKGVATRSGNRRVLLATELTQNGDTTQLDRSRGRFEGEITSTRRVNVRGQEHLLAIVESNGRRRAVDLGPSRSLQKFDLNVGDRITVSGPPVKANDRVIVFAQQISQNGERRRINRGSQQMAQQERHQRDRQRGQQAQNRQRFEREMAARNRRQERQRGQQRAYRPEQDREQQQRLRRVRGEIVGLRTATVRGQDRQIARIENPQGNTLIVDLGPARSFRADLNRGDQITAFGRIARTPGDRPVMLAHRIRAGDRTWQISPQQQGRNKRKLSGEIVNMGTATIRGEDRQMVTLELQNGNRAHADLGPKNRFDANLRNGDHITVTGTLAAHPDETIVVATSMTHDGESTNIRRSGREDQRSNRNQRSGRSQQSNRQSQNDGVYR